MPLSSLKSTFAYPLSTTSQQRGHPRPTRPRPPPEDGGDEPCCPDCAAKGFPPAAPAAAAALALFARCWDRRARTPHALHNVLGPAGEQHSMQHGSHQQSRSESPPGRQPSPLLPHIPKQYTLDTVLPETQSPTQHCATHRQGPHATEV